MQAVSSDVFWAQLQSLCSLLAPFAQAVALVQSRGATLADVATHLLQLANLLEASKANGVVPAGKPRKPFFTVCDCVPLHAARSSAACRYGEVCIGTQT